MNNVTPNQVNDMNNQNQNQNQNQNGKPAVTAADIPLTLKARYFASGLAVGVIVSPLVRRTLGKLQPKLDSLMDTLTGHAEGAVEKGSDLVAKAKDVLRSFDKEERHDHAKDAGGHA